MYPADWPKCPNCGAPALDGHITCGSFSCDESGTRNKIAAETAEIESETMTVACISCGRPTDTGQGPLCEGCAVETHR